MGKGGGGGGTAKPASRVSYRKEKARDQVMGGQSRKAMGARYYQTRKQTPTGGSSFGGQKPTLG